MGIEIGLDRTPLGATIGLPDETHKNVPKATDRSPPPRPGWFLLGPEELYKISKKVHRPEGLQKAAQVVLSEVQPSLQIIDPR